MFRIFRWFSDFPLDFFTISNWKSAAKSEAFAAAQPVAPCAPKHDMMIALQLPGATLVWIWTRSCIRSTKSTTNVMNCKFLLSKQFLLDIDYSRVLLLVHERTTENCRGQPRFSTKFRSAISRWCKWRSLESNSTACRQKFCGSKVAFWNFWFNASQNGKCKETIWRCKIAIFETTKCYDEVSQHHFSFGIKTQLLLAKLPRSQR